jgi:O-antigen/teichoic acid export membrane protein
LSFAFYAPKVFFFGLLLLLEIIEAVFSKEWEPLDSTVAVIVSVKKGLYLAFLVWFVFLVRLVFAGIDSSEHFKLKVYVTVFSTVFSFVLADCLFGKCTIHKGSSVSFTMRFAALQAFVLFMVFSHWTCDYEFNDGFGQSVASKRPESIRDFVDSSSS